MRKILALTAASLTAMTLAAIPAHASNTTATFTVAAGGLSLSTTTTAQSLGTASSSATGTSVSAALPQVTVTDTRGGINGWNSQVSTTNWVDNNNTPADTTDDKTVAANKGTMWTTAPAIASGIVVPTTTYLTQQTGLALSTTPQNFVSGTLVVGSNSVTYTPSIAVTIDSTVLTGTYSATVTQTAL